MPGKSFETPTAKVVPKFVEDEGRQGGLMVGQRVGQRGQVFFDGLVEQGFFRLMTAVAVSHGRDRC